MDRSEIIDRLRRNRARLEALGVTRAYLFGSGAGCVRAGQRR